MMVIVTENVTPRLRGRLAVWFLEVRAGVYLGKSNQRHRKRVWRTVQKEIQESGQGNAVMAWTRRNEMGFDFRTCGKNRRKPKEVDGLKLISFLPDNEETLPSNEEDLER